MECRGTDRRTSNGGHLKKHPRGAEHPEGVMLLTLSVSERNDRVDREQELVVLLAVVEG